MNLQPLNQYMIEKCIFDENLVFCLKCIKLYLTTKKNTKVICDMLSIILNNLVCIIKFWMGSVYGRKHQQSHKTCRENTLFNNVLF